MCVCVCVFGGGGGKRTESHLFQYCLSLMGVFNAVLKAWED